ncbi:MAG: NAD(P)-binding domain-containing protein [Ignavibacteria bacterium]
MEIYIEKLLTYGIIFLVAISVLFYYLYRYKMGTAIVKGKIQKAKEFGFHEPVSLHPVVNIEMCIGSGACILACPEKDILGLVHGHATPVNTSRCVGHGACFHACPMNAIALHMGTEKRGVELPHVNEEFESNVQGLYIAGELGGMGLIKNAVEQGRQAVENISHHVKPHSCTQYDVIIVGAGPAGISATLAATKANLRYLTLEQDSLGGTVYHYPRKKIVMTSPMELPLYGKVKLLQTSKAELLELWETTLEKNKISINVQEKVTTIDKTGEHFEVVTSKGNYTADFILLAIGRRGSPRKLNVLGEEKEKIAYKLIEPEYISDKKILIVGGGDSAIEAALALTHEGNEVTISYRGKVFSRIKPQNSDRILAAERNKELKILFNSNVLEIEDDSVALLLDNDRLIIENDLVYIFAGGELPMQFLEKIGIRITKKFGEAIFKK